MPRAEKRGPVEHSGISKVIHVREEGKKQSNMFSKAKKAGLDTKALGEQMAEEKQTLTAKYKAEGLSKLATPTFRGTKLA